MQSFVLRWLVNSVAIYLTTRIIHGVRIPDFGAAIVAALVLGIVNAFIRPLVLILTLPVNILTLGLFSLIISTAMLALTASLSSKLDIDGFWSAFGAALVVAVVSAVVEMFTRRALTS